MSPAGLDEAGGCMKEEVRFYAITSVAVAYPAGLDDFGACKEICRGIEFSRAPA